MIENEDVLLEFLTIKAKKVMVCIDWANVYNWRRFKRLERVKRIEEKVDPKQLHTYLRKIKQVKVIKLFFGLDKAREDVLDNMVRWIEKRKGKEIRNIAELSKELNDLQKKEKLSDALKIQIKEVLDEYFSSLRLIEFEKIGFDISNQKDVKSFSI